MARMEQSGPQGRAKLESQADLLGRLYECEVMVDKLWRQVIGKC